MENSIYFNPWLLEGNVFIEVGEMTKPQFMFVFDYPLLNHCLNLLKSLSCFFTLMLCTATLLQSQRKT